MMLELGRFGVNFVVGVLNVCGLGGLLVFFLVWRNGVCIFVEEFDGCVWKEVFLVFEVG